MQGANISGDWIKDTQESSNDFFQIFCKSKVFSKWNLKNSFNGKVI